MIDTKPRPIPTAWRPTSRIWITCGGCQRLGHVPKAVTVIDQETGDRLWTCSDCGLSPEARARAIDKRLGIMR